MHLVREPARGVFEVLPLGIVFSVIQDLPLFAPATAVEFTSDFGGFFGTIHTRLGHKTP